MDFKKIFKNKIFLIVMAAVVVITGLFMINGGNKYTTIKSINDSFVTSEEGKELVQKYKNNNQDFVLAFIDADDLEEINEWVDDPNDTSDKRTFLNMNERVLQLLNINKNPKIIIHAEEVEDDDFWKSLGAPKKDTYDWRRSYRNGILYGKTATGRFEVKNHQIFYSDNIEDINGQEIPEKR